MGASNLPVPVTLLSGFLGGGKTTLLKQILEQKEEHGMKIAVLVNDLAKVNIDAALIKNTKMISSEEKMLELHNGCICCTLREDLLIELTKLAISTLDKIDAIIIESTGVSEPQQVAETFTFPFDPEAEDDHSHDRKAASKTQAELKKEHERMEKVEEIRGILDQAAKILGHQPTFLNEIARLDTCVTVVDCNAFSGDLTTAQSLIERYHDKEGEVAEEDERSVSTLLVDQLEFANVVLLNKTDLVSPEQVSHIRKAIEVLNPTAKVCATRYAKVELSDVVNTNLFNMEVAEKSYGWLKSLQEDVLPETEEYGISSFVYRARAPFHPKRLLAFLETIFFVELASYEDEEEEEEDNDKDKKENGDDKINGEDKIKINGEDKFDLWGKKSVKERDDAVETCIRTMKDNYGHIYRSKGFLWLAGRDQQHGEWSQAGSIGEITRGGLWLGVIPKEALPEVELDKMQRDFQEGMVQDRRQEIVIIGSDLKKDAITKALDACLLTYKENFKDLSMKWAIPKEYKQYTKKDMKANYWKFGWKPPTPEDDPVPEWPSMEEMLEDAEEE